MTPRSPIFELEPIVAGIGDLHQPAGRSPIGVVSNSEHSTMRIKANPKRIPEPSGDAPQPLSIQLTSEYTAFSRAVLCAIVAANHSIRLAEVLTHPKVQVAISIER
jgi:hypothetical protein